jgi:hypothetical protein
VLRRMEAGGGGGGGGGGRGQAGAKLSLLGRRTLSNLLGDTHSAPNVLGGCVEATPFPPLADRSSRSTAAAADASAVAAAAGVLSSLGPQGVACMVRGWRQQTL